MVSSSKRLTYPKRKNYTKKRTRTRGRKKGLRRSMNSINATNPFPKQFATKLRFESTFDIDAGLGAAASHLFRANSVFDPDFTGGGYQPRYFDQIMPLYDHFTVIGAKITVKAVNPNNESYVVGIQLNGAGTSVSKINDLIEQRNSTYKWVGHQYSNKAIQTITKTFSAKKFLGISKPMAEDDLRGTIASNPSEGAYFVVTAGAHDPDINPGVLPLRAIIDYIVIFTEPRTVGSS